MAKSRRGTIVALAAIIGLAGFGGGAVGAPRGQTVADFAVKVFRGSLPRQEAMTALQRLAPALQNPEAPLTEGSLVQVLKGFGVAASTGQPGSFVDQGRADAALFIIWGSGSGASQGPSPAGTGPINLATCEGGNIWACMKCCNEQGFPIASCSRSCTFGVSPSSP